MAIQPSKYRIKAQLFLSENVKRRGEGGIRIHSHLKKSYAGNPLISIVTVVYNGQKHIEQTIQSVLGQSYDNIEYIVIDGGSTDNTVEIIKKYEEKIDYWVSEPDSGIYNAMNKGSSLCTGDYVAFLNADDWYNADTIETVVEKIKEQDVDYVFGNVDLIRDGKVETVFTPDLQNYKKTMPFGHPSLFLKRSILLKFGFNEKHKVVADYGLILQLINHKCSYYYVDKSLTNFRLGGISSLVDLNKEHLKLYYEHFGLFFALSYFLKYTNNPFIKNTKLLIKWLIRYRS